MRPRRRPLHPARDVQYPHRVRELLAGVSAGPGDRGARRRHDVGGAFGAKGWAHLEHRHVLWLARRLGRAVKWTCDRSESLLADEHGRDLVRETEIALDADGSPRAARAQHRRARRLRLHRPQPAAAFVNLGSLAGMYVIPAAHVRVPGVFSHTPVARALPRQRPAGSDLRARAPDRRRRARAGRRPRRTAPAQPDPARMPYKTAITFTYDCGDFEKTMDLALATVDLAGFPARRDAARKRGQLRGHRPRQCHRARRRAGHGVRGDPLRSRAAATLAVGTKSQGQGHETMYRQIAASALGHRARGPALHRRATPTRSPGARAAVGSRSAAIGGSALWLAADKVIAKGKRIAAHLLEAADADIAFADGRFTIAGTDRGADDQGSGARLVRLRRAAARHRAGAFREREPSRRCGNLPQRHPRLRGRGRSRDRPTALVELHGGGRRRHRDQPAHAARARWWAASCRAWARS